MLLLMLGLLFVVVVVVHGVAAVVVVVFVTVAVVVRSYRKKSGSFAVRKPINPISGLKIKVLVSLHLKCCSLPI